MPTRPTYRCPLCQELLGVSSVIQSDSLFSKDLKAKTEQAVQDTIVATNIIEGFKNPHQSAAYLKNHASFPLEYVISTHHDGSFNVDGLLTRFFTRVTQEMQERLQWYKNTIEVCHVVSVYTSKPSNDLNSKLSENYQHRHLNPKIHHKVSLSFHFSSITLVLTLHPSSDIFYPADAARHIRLTCG